MKKIMLFTLAFLVSLGSFGQNSGKGFNFQAVARNSDGSVKAEQSVHLLIRIYPTKEKNGVIYAENCEATTDKFGVFSLIVGKGTYFEGSASTFEDINFSLADAYMNVALKDGSTETEIVHAPMLSVPYAESSTQADNGMPIGAILPYAGMVPDNTDDITVYGCKGTWRLCNGQEYEPGLFHELDEVLKNAWGTNRLPDLRGVFLRGTSPATALDNFYDPDADDRKPRYDGGNEGSQVGSFQGDTLKAHSHEYMDKWAWQNDKAAKGLSTFKNHPIVDDKRNTFNTGGLETRPKNANVNFIIRVK